MIAQKYRVGKAETASTNSVMLANVLQATTSPISSTPMAKRRRYANKTPTMHVDRATPNAVPMRSAPKACAQTLAKQVKSSVAEHALILKQIPHSAVPTRRAGVLRLAREQRNASMENAFCRNARPMKRCVRRMDRRSASTSMAITQITVVRVDPLASTPKRPKRPDAIKANALIFATITW